MFTLQEFLMNVKATEYLIAIGFITCFILYWLLLTSKPAPEEMGSAQETQVPRDRAA